MRGFCYLIKENSKTVQRSREIKRLLFTSPTNGRVKKKRRRKREEKNRKKNPKRALWRSAGIMAAARRRKGSR